MQSLVISLLEQEPAEGLAVAVVEDGIPPIFERSILLEMHLRICWLDLEDGVVDILLAYHSTSTVYVKKINQLPSISFNSMDADRPYASAVAIQWLSKTFLQHTFCQVAWLSIVRQHSMARSIMVFARMLLIIIL